jgi:hypothetical protein
MAKINSNASDKQNDAMTTTTNALGNLSITTSPIVITAVQRKANIGNYETIDLYMAVALPQSDMDLLDQDALTDSLTKAADYGFSLVAKATGDRYVSIKESIKSR